MMHFRHPQTKGRDQEWQRHKASSVRVAQAGAPWAQAWVETWKADHRWKLTGCEEPSGLALDEKTGHLFTVCGNEKMLVLEAATGKILATLDTGAGTDGAAFDPALGYAFASNGGDGTLTIVKAGKQGQYEVIGQIPTQRGARTLTVDPKSHRVFLPTAELGPPAEGQRRPTIKPGSFTVLVFKPKK